MTTALPPKIELERLHQLLLDAWRAGKLVNVRLRAGRLADFDQVLAGVQVCSVTAHNEYSYSALLREPETNRGSYYWVWPVWREGQRIVDVEILP